MASTTSTLSALEIGDETGVPVVFIHGWEMDSKAEAYDFEPIFSTLSPSAASTASNPAIAATTTTHSPNYRRIYIDLPGMGNSAANSIRDLDEMFERVVSFIDTRLGETAHFLVVGASCGGYLARAVARRYRTRVDGLLLRVPVVEPDDKARDRDAFEPLVRDDQVMAALPAVVRNVVGDKVLVQTPAYVASLRATFENAVLPAISAADTDALAPIRSDPLRYRLTVPLEENDEGVKLAAPTLILTGRQDDHVGYRDALRLLDWYPRATFAVLDRAEHSLPLDDQRDLFNNLVRDWLARVVEWSGTRELR
jgi:pimeloyl-ACP methyl ester carboxylesterase